MNWMDWAVAHEAGIRLGTFAGFLAVLLLLERLLPYRGDTRASARQARNFGLVLIDTAVLRLAFPVLAVAWAMSVQQQGLGLFTMVGWAGWVEVIIAILVLDAAIYWQHRLFHMVPLFWRLHRVHHSDLAFDVTTGVRFHPFEIALSMGIKLGLILLLGADPFAVLLFEVLLATGSLFTHADFAFPNRLDRALRWIFVTPSMHRIHHSVIRAETDSNFGFHLSVWDRLFRSYTANSASEPRTMPIGLNEFRSGREQSFFALLIQPFRSGDRNA